MAYRRIDDNDTVEIRRAQGGNKPETRTVAELNEYFSKEEGHGAYPRLKPILNSQTHGCSGKRTM